MDRTPSPTLVGYMLKFNRLLSSLRNVPSRTKDLTPPLIDLSAEGWPLKRLSARLMVVVFFFFGMLSSHGVSLRMTLSSRQVSFYSRINAILLFPFKSTWSFLPRLRDAERAPSCSLTDFPFRLDLRLSPPRAARCRLPLVLSLSLIFFF